MGKREGRHIFHVWCMFNYKKFQLTSLARRTSLGTGDVLVTLLCNVWTLSYVFNTFLQQCSCPEELGTAGAISTIPQMSKHLGLTRDRVLPGAQESRLLFWLPLCGLVCRQCEHVALTEQIHTLFIQTHTPHLPLLPTNSLLYPEFYFSILEHAQSFPSNAWLVSRNAVSSIPAPSIANNGISFFFIISFILLGCTCPAVLP